jgi:hypothetical protein
VPQLKIGTSFPGFLELNAKPKHAQSQSVLLMQTVQYYTGTVHNTTGCRQHKVLYYIYIYYTVLHALIDTKFPVSELP